MNYRRFNYNFIKVCSLESTNAKEFRLLQLQNQSIYYVNYKIHRYLASKYYAPIDEGKLKLNQQYAMVCKISIGCGLELIGKPINFETFRQIKLSLTWTHFTITRRSRKCKRANTLADYCGLGQAAQTHLHNHLNTLNSYLTRQSFGTLGLWIPFYACVTILFNYENLIIY